MKTAGISRIKKYAIILLLGLAGAAPLSAQVPRVINYQGELIQDDQPVSGTFTITFSIYAESTAGTPLWSETHTVTAEEGTFHALLGSSTTFPENLFTSEERYLGIQVDAASEMTPRLPIASTAFTLTAETAYSVPAGAIDTEALADQAVTSAKIADQGVTADKLAPGIVVANVNGLVGPVILLGSGGTTIQADDTNNTITISAPGGGGGGDGDITGVIAGAGLAGGGTSGDVALSLADLGVTTPKIADQAVTAAKLDAVAAVKQLDGLAGNVILQAGANIAITNDGVDTITISTSGGGGGEGDITSVVAGAGLTGGGTVGDVTLSIADLGVATPKIADLAVTSGKLGDLAVTTPKIADLGVSTAKLADQAVTAGKLASDAAVLSLNSLAGGVTLAAGNNVTITDDGASTITIAASGGGGGGDITSVIAGAGLTGGGTSGDVTLSLADLGVTTPKIADLAVTSAKIADQGVSTPQIADLAVTSAKIGNLAVATNQLGDLAVTTPKIADQGVTTSKIADQGVTAGKLASDAAVLSLNSLAGGVTLAAGNNVTITDNGTNTITISASILSSRRWKTNIAPIENALDTVKRLRGVTFDWKEDGRSDIGLIAEEVGEVLPELVEFEENGTDARSVAYGQMVAVLIEAIKAQQTQLETQRQELDTLTERLATIERLMQARDALPRTGNATNGQ